MTNLKAVKVGMNRFCGPAVLSTLTGKSTDECAMTISKINGQYTIAGVWLSDLLKAADRLGFDSQEIRLVSRSLFGVITQLSRTPGMYIISLETHFVAVEVTENKTAYLCDNHTKEPIRAESSARLSQKVIQATKVIERVRQPEPEPPKLLMEDIEVVVSNLGIHVDRVSLYDDPDYNTKKAIGTITARDEKELELIIRRLADQPYL